LVGIGSTKGHELNEVSCDSWIPFGLLLRGHLRADALFLLPELRSELVTEIRRFKHLTNLDFGVFKGCFLKPLDRFIQRLHLPQPEACNQLFGFREWSLNHTLLAV